MTSHLSDVGSTRSHDLLMPSTRFDYMSKSTANIDTLLLYVEGIDRKGFVSSRAKQSSELNDQIRSRERVNIVQSRGFRETLKATLTRYTNRAITTAQIIEELIGLARTIREAVEQGTASGLTEEEMAFYDALADNESARQHMQDAALKLIARELAERIKTKVSLDWIQRETVRADMRRTIRRLLTKYGYPPVAQESATQLVIRQAELMAEEIVNLSERN
jgi:type I restriction enzyme, R subunit